MAILWNRTEEPAKEPEPVVEAVSEPVVEPIDTEEEMQEWVEASAADLGEMLYGDEEEMGEAKVWKKTSKKGFGN